MRTAIYDYIDGLSAAIKGSFTLSTELPWDQNGNPLYLNNLKRIYVDVDQISQTANINSLAFIGAVDETSVVRVFFVNDAKQLPSNYDTLVSAVKDARLTTAITGVIERLCQVSTSFDQDRLITQFEFSFKKTITN
jgi:hypothetical protein